MAVIKVGTKLPNGIIMSLGEKKVKLNGSNHSKVIGGHGITENVDKDFFDAWMKAHAGQAYVKQGLIFAHASDRELAAEAKDKSKNKNGMEGLSPKAHGVKPATDDDE